VHTNKAGTAIGTIWKTHIFPEQRISICGVKVTKMPFINIHNLCGANKMTQLITHEQGTMVQFLQLRGFNVASVQVEDDKIVLVEITGIVGDNIYTHNKLIDADWNSVYEYVNTKSASRIFGE